MEQQKEHSILAPSADKRWFSCSGSPQLIAQCPEVPPSRYAAQGTAAHAIAARILAGENLVAGKFEADGHVFLLSNKDEDNSVSLEHVYYYVNYVWDQVAEYGLQPNQVRTESRVTLHGIDADGSPRIGTVDRMHFVPGVKLHIIDFKYGAGVGVDPNESYQCFDYALAVWKGLTPEQRAVIPIIEITIVQPRGMYRGIKTAALTPPVIEAFESTLDAAIARVNNNPQLVPGPWCAETFCSAKRFCDPAKKYAEEAIGVKYDVAVLQKPLLANELPVIEPSKLSADQLAFILERKKFVENWLSEIEKEAYRRYKQGEVIPRHKIVRKMTHRQFTDEVKVAEDFADLGSDLWTEPTLRSPNQIEQALRARYQLKDKEAKERVKPYTYKPEGEKIIVPETDKRPAVLDAKDEYQKIIDAEVVG